jgi:hypothetical protein
VLTRHARPQVALIPYETFLQLLAFTEEELLAEYGRQAAGIAGQNVDYAAAEVEEDVATAVAAIRDNTPGRWYKSGCEGECNPKLVRITEPTVSLSFSFSLHFPTSTNLTPTLFDFRH